MSLLSVGVSNPVVVGAGGLASRAPRALTSISDVTTGDAVGDCGLLNGAVYQLASVTGPDATTQRIWVRPRQYAGTISLSAYYAGTEANAAEVLAKGLTRFANGGAQSLVSGYFRQSVTNTGTETIGTLNASIGTSTRVYTRFEARVSTGGTYNLFLVVADGANAVYWAQNNLSGGTAGALSAVNASAQVAGTTAQYRGGRSALPTTTPDLIEIDDDGTTGICTVHRNGLFYGAFQRATMFAGTDRVYWGASISATGTAFLETRNCISLTY